MNSTIDISKLIDQRNEDLWLSISSRYHVDFLPSTNAEYSCYTERNNVTFFIPLNDYCTSSFTHELLHVYIRLKEVYISANLMLRIREGRFLQEIFTSPLLEHIGNCLDHIKMLPIYLQHGFAREKFLLDYKQHKCTEKEITDIKKYYKINGRYYSPAVEVFIGKFFAMKADPNDGFNYDNCFVELRKIDAALYDLLDEFVTSWMAYDLDNNDIFNSYRDIVDRLYDGLVVWKVSKVFV